MLKIFFTNNSTIAIKTSRLPLKSVHLYSSNGIYMRTVHKKKTKLPIDWSSKVLKCFKRNTTFESEIDFGKLITSYHSYYPLITR